jgi:enoyl-CoA hydratase
MSIHIEKKDRITTIIINRPEVRNAIDGPTAKALADAFQKFDNDPEADIAVLYGAGGTFCAGADLKTIANPQEKQRALRFEPTGNGPLGPTRMFLSKPVIAAVSGYALAGGLELALLCDLRVAEKDAIFGVFCRRWGIPLVDGGTIRLPRLIGLSRALDMILTGRGVSAAEALNIGLVNRVVENGKSREAAEALASEIARFPQVCVRHDRSSAYEQFGMGLPEALANEFRHGMEVFKSGESVAGADRFAKGKGRGGSFSDL